MKLFMVMLGCKPKGRKTEQHDIFFGISENIKGLVNSIKNYWQDSGKIHIDAWREVTLVEGHRVEIVSKGTITEANDLAALKLFFINLGGYKKNEFDEFHYKMLVPARDTGEAIRIAKTSAFYRHTGFKGATSHIDDKYGVDVDDIYSIPEILSQPDKSSYALKISPGAGGTEDVIHLGYFILDKF